MELCILKVQIKVHAIAGESGSARVKHADNDKTHILALNVDLTPARVGF
jgi:hypothetical protein